MTTLHWVGIAIVGLLGLAAGPVLAQGLAPGFVDPVPVLAAARKAIGADALKCVTVTGTAYDGAVGQARLSEKGVDWPRIDSLANYTRTMNWDTHTMKEEFDRKPGLSPAGWKYGIGWVDGPLQKNLHQTFMLNGTTGWYTDGPASPPVAINPDIASIFPVELYLNPHGCLKAAQMPGANPEAVWRWELKEMGGNGIQTTPERMIVVGITVLGKYRVDATINKENMLQRIHTWVPNPVLGDMNYEHEFTNGSYVDVGNGIKFPTGWHSHEGWDDNFQGQSVSAGHNAFGGTMKDIKANVCPDPVAIPEAVRTATFPVRADMTKLADGVYLVGGSSHNSVAVEFRDYIAVVEAPIDEKRALAVIDQVTKTIPNKPIRFLVNTHQHFDHAGGLRTFWHVGATLITHWLNWDFYNRDVINYTPRTLAPDMLSRWPPTELSEGYNVEAVRENYVLTDGTRTMNVHFIPTQHANGMLMVYLPKERMLIEADIVSTLEPLPAMPTPDMRALRNEVRALKLDVGQLVPIHGKPMAWADFDKFAATPGGAPAAAE